VQLNPDDIDAGYDAGRALAEARFGKMALVLASSAIAKSHRQLATILTAWPQDLSTDFVRLFAQLHALAAIARSVNDEPPLTEDDTRAFLAHAASFFNSFKHK
jgi:hypothetical protein